MNVQAQAHQAVTHQHQLADHVHDLVEPRSVYPHRSFGFAGHRFFLRCRCCPGRCRAWGGRLGFDLAGDWRCNRTDGSCDRWAFGRKLAFAMQLVEQCFKFLIGDVCCRRVYDGFSRDVSRGSGDSLKGVCAERALAVQLVQQRFEFIVSDFIAARSSRCRGYSGRGSGHGVRRELAFAVQLIEQGLELGVADFVAQGRVVRGLFDKRRISLDRIQRVEQLFKFVIGNVAGAVVRHGLDHHSSRFDRCRGSSRLGQTRQRGQQLRAGGGDRAALAHLGKHPVDGVQGFKHHVHQFCVDAALTLAQDVEHVLGDVAALHQLIELQEAGASFYSVKTAKNSIEQVSIIRSAFQLDQLFGQQL